jgi:hypothetical protein
MKSKKQNNAAVSPIVFTPDLMNLPGGKQVFKQLNALNELKNLDNKLKPVVDAASIAFGEKFETFAQVVKYVAKKTGEKTFDGRRGLTDEQKQKIIALKDINSAKEIAEEVKCKPTQVSAYIFNSKKKKK